MKERVACFIRTYLFPSETFIYEEIRSIEKFKVFILAPKVVNTRLFPYPDIISPEEKERSGFILTRGHRERNFFCKVLGEKNIKLVHAWYAWSGMRVLPVCRRVGVPLMVSFHGMDVSRLPRHFFYRRNLQKLFRKANFFLVRSSSMKDDLIELGCPPEKLLVHYGGVDIDRFEPPERRKPGKKVLMCGRMVEKKGFDYGILAFSETLKKHPQSQLAIIGEGKLEKDLKKLVQDLGVEKKVDFCGRIPHDKVKEKMREANIFLSPNVTAHNKDKEGIPNVIKEAMATQLPVVATYHAGVPELVVDGETGFLVPEKDTRALAEKLDYLLSSWELQNTMGQKGREVVEKKFNLIRQTRELENIYSKLLEEDKDGGESK